MWTGVDKSPALGGAAGAGPISVTASTGLGFGTRRPAIGVKPGIAGKAQLEFTAGSAPHGMKGLTNG
jgi:hypothetical protein